MAKPLVRQRFVEVALGFAFVGLLARAAQVQLVEGRRWRAEAVSARTREVVLPARRGMVSDRNGVALAVTQETYHMGIAPNELRDPARTLEEVSRRLHISMATLRASLSRRYAYFGGPFPASQVQPLRGMPGLHFERELNRFYPSPNLARAVVGRAGEEGKPATGLERALDDWLTGDPGAAVVLRDRAQREYESPARVLRQPEDGHDVVLTIDAELQEIAERELARALAQTGAAAGDVVILGARTGEVLAAASRTQSGAARPSAFTDIFEPGSTVKVFAAAALLEQKRVGPTERVSGEGGELRLPDRTLHDEHPLTSMTLADAIRVSSNVGVVKFADRLAPAEQFGMLRDFGFGAPTGVEFPSESPGRLPRPHQWSRPTPASLAIGYEVGLTAIQLAAAYGALANDGVLLRPTLVREIRGPDGRLVFRHKPEPVRRVVRPEVAAQLREMLREVVDTGGTGRAAALRTFTVAGKTGTAQRFVGGRYVNEYTATFAALFPAEAPQLVLVVKLDNPQRGSHFGGLAAAPVTRAVLEQALAARDVGLDRSSLAAVSLTTPGNRSDEPRGIVPYVVAWPAPAADAGTEDAPPRAVPNVSGMDLREALRVLHDQGFRVTLSGLGAKVGRTEPAAGVAARQGATIRVVTERP
jgi:cell division protein FtsI (penicillin-binding protein 3)